MSDQSESTLQLSGHCLCGKIEINAKTVQTQVHVCHCNMCRQWNGGPSHSVHCGTDVNFRNPESISVYQSCDWAELGFCKHCGSHLFYRFLDGGSYILATGILENPAAFELTQQLFIEEKPAYYSYANDTENLTGEQVFAQYAQQQE